MFNALPALKMATKKPKKMRACSKTEMMDVWPENQNLALSLQSLAGGMVMNMPGDRTMKESSGRPP